MTTGDRLQLNYPSAKRQRTKPIGHRNLLVQGCAGEVLCVIRMVVIVSATYEGDKDGSRIAFGIARVI